MGNKLSGCRKQSCSGEGSLNRGARGLSREHMRRLAAPVLEPIVAASALVRAASHATAEIPPPPSFSETPKFLLRSKRTEASLERWAQKLPPPTPRRQSHASPKAQAPPNETKCLVPHVWPYRSAARGHTCFRVGRCRLRTSMCQRHALVWAHRAINRRISYHDFVDNLRNEGGPT